MMPDLYKGGCKPMAATRTFLYLELQVLSRSLGLAAVLWSIDDPNR